VSEGDRIMISLELSMCSSSNSSSSSKPDHMNPTTIEDLGSLIAVPSLVRAIERDRLTLCHLDDRSWSWS